MPKIGNAPPSFGSAPQGTAHQRVTPGRKRAALLRLCRYVMRFRFWVILALLLTVLSNYFGLMGPYLSGLAVDSIGSEAGAVQFPLVFRYCLFMALFYVASALLSYLLSMIMITISRKVTYQMRSDIFNKLSSLPVGYFDTHQAGDIISRISYDTDTINSSLSTDLVQVLASVITVGGSLGMMIAISPRLVLVFLITVPLSICITRFITSRTRPLFRLRSLKIGQLNGFTEENITGLKTLQSYCQEEHTIEKLDQVNDETVNAYYNAEYYSSRVGPSVNFINNLSLALITVFGAILFMQGKMSVGNISSFVLYSRKFSGPINEIANIIGELQSALAAAERVFRLLDEQPEKADSPQALPLHDPQGDVELQDVSFGYEEGKTILHHLSLHASPGSMIAIVGPTGAGKTTLINLLMRFYDKDSGEIKVDGHSIYDLQRKSLCLAYSMVLQDTWLFYGTIYENIAYGKQGITREEVIQAAKAAKIHSYIQRLPQGYDTLLTDDGTNISKGQKQLLTIARAMVMDSHMLILDEATSNVDTRTEMQIQEAMRRLMENKTCFVVAHRLSTIRNADLILVVRDGNVVESGTHEELMKKRGFYRELYEAQFK
ncbi:ABC transporter ATP-binding protein [Intestinimonas sp. MSJ-38]|uniref:ABC transporter ATP-binding protein n=1 Tax=Intestinimonas sp. MSJ-38 TaxID=2841532 RepID=UPI001C0F4FEC|nr:ABC transporter ATP-binding protein [Intestinimonas sp. MSJ-38]MBU5432129.1 ABC transporter ATP-binding protein/permease [Intestinimonas sp. MSJ-38]